VSDTSLATEVDVVRSFLGALDRLDIDAAAALLHPDVVYQNVPLPPARGARAVERQLRGMARFGTGFEARIHNIAADGPVVLTERTDVLEVGRLRLDFWVCGTFEVRDGRVVLWRDYFDYANLLWAFVRGALRAVVGGR
jgi:limonene-1,2-epoxide hydrolase